MRSFITLHILSVLLVGWTCTVHAQSSRLDNLSTHGICETGDAVFVNEFILQGTGTETILQLGIGPSLPVTDTLQDPTGRLLGAHGRTLDKNNDWMDNPDKDAIIATGLAPTDPRESAMIDTLKPGTYSFVEQGTRRSQGVALSEIFDLRDGGLQVSAIGTRAFVSTGENALISGIIIIGDAPISLLIRALGPSLADVGLSGVLPDPFLELFNSNGQEIFSNDNWRDTQEIEIIATGLAPTNDFESAMLVTLEPGAYSVTLSGVNETTGLGFVQFYDLGLPIRELNPAPIIKRGH